MLGTGVAFPLAISHGAVALAAGADDVEQAIRIILATAPGERPMRPEFGCDLHTLVFERMTATTIGRMERAIRSALHRWEPRIEVEQVSIRADARDAGTLLVDVGYRLCQTNSRRNLIYPFYLVPAGERR